MQSLDAHFSTLDFTSFQTTWSYFREICTALPDATDEVVDTFFQAVEAEIQVASQETVNELHQILNDYIMEAHNILQHVHKRNAEYVSNELMELLAVTITLVSKALYGDQEHEIALSSIVKPGKSKDPAQKGADYESIG